MPAKEKSGLCCSPDFLWIILRDLSSVKLHDRSRRTARQKFSSHIVHGRGCVLEEASVSLAQIVETGLSIGCDGETIFRTLAVAKMQPPTAAALSGQRVALVLSEFLLLGAVHHFKDSLSSDIPKPILRENKVIAGIEVSIVLYDGSMATCTRHRAYTRFNTDRIRECGVEKLNKNTSDVITNPLIKNST